MTCANFVTRPRQSALDPVDPCAYRMPSIESDADQKLDVIGKKTPVLSDLKQQFVTFSLQFLQHWIMTASTEHRASTLSQ